MGIGEWGLGNGDWAQSPIPTSQTQTPTIFTTIENKFKKEEYHSLNINDILSIDDIKINSLEEDVQNIIKEKTSSISDSKQKNKKIFVLKNDKEEKNNNEIKEIKENIINDEENNTNKKKVN